MKVVISGDSSGSSGFLYKPRELKRSGVEVMAAWRRAIELSLGDEVKILKKAAAAAKKKPGKAVAIISYDEKPASRQPVRTRGHGWREASSSTVREDSPGPSLSGMPTTPAKSWLRA
jgi:hypothetical protein